MLEKSPRLRVVGVTTFTDRPLVEQFRSEAGATWPILFGATPAMKTAYGITYVPALRVVIGGKVVGTSLEDLEKALGS